MQANQVDSSTTIIDSGYSGDDLSIVTMQLDGCHVGHPNRRSINTYVVNVGTVTVVVDDEEYRAKPGDIVVAPVGTRRMLTGKADITLISSPPWRLEDET